MYQLRLPFDYPRLLTPKPNYQQEIFYISTFQGKLLEDSLPFIFLATWCCLIYRYHQEKTIISVDFDSLKTLEGNQSYFEFSSITTPILKSTTFEGLLTNIKQQIKENKVFTKSNQKSNVGFINSHLVDIDALANKLNFDLLLSTNFKQNYQKDSYQCQLVYDNKLFDNKTINRIISHFKVLLASIIDNPQQCIDKLSLLTRSEKHKLLHELNQTQRKHLTDKCIHQLIEEQVEKNPEQIAVIFEDEQLTYRELNQKANQLANYLQKSGIIPGDFIGLFLEPSLTRIIGLLAIFKVGGIYLPLDPNYPLDRLRFMIEDSNISILLTQESLHCKLSRKSLKMINLDTDSHEIAQESFNNIVANIAENNLAYIIYTSGSTGVPKGVLIDHKSLSHHCQNITDNNQLNIKDRILQFASFSFDVSLEQILPTLAVGASLILVDAKNLTIFNLNKIIIDLRLTVVNFPPSYLTQWLEFLEKDECKHSFNQLRLVISGGEALPLNTVKKWNLSPLKNISLINAYGPTEATITAITFTVPKDKSIIESYSTIPIGRPLPNRTTYILDAQQNPVPIGVFGELYIGGEGLACGYLNQLELTQEKFIDNPFGTEKLYKTGDLARYLTDGNIEFLGRIDNQVKIRGFRVELGEIETILTQHFQVKEAKVMIREDKYNNQRLVAYIITSLGEISASDISHEIREYLKKKLPNYMIPSALIFLEAFPLNTNGKIDYAAFPEPDFSTFQSNYVAPKTPTEEIIANIWNQVIKIENIGINDDFFELGGDSLLAIQVVSRIREILNIEIPISLLFEYPTIAQIAQNITLKAANKNDLLITEIQTRKQQENLILSFAQQRLWFLQQLEPNNTAYNLVYRFRIQGLLNINALEKSLAEIKNRHEILRTNFISVNGKPNQKINNNSFKLPIIDLQTFPNEEKVIEAEKIAKQELAYPFNLSEDSLFRVKLIKWNSQEYQLLFNIHHIIFDGWSFGLLFSELKSLYTAYSQGVTSPLKPLQIQYVDFTLWQKKYLSQEFLEPQLNYWKKQLAGSLPILEVAKDNARPKIQTYNGATKTFILSSQLTAQIKVFSRIQGVTIFMTLVAAFKILLSRYSGQEDVIVGTAMAGRRSKNIENLMGFFVNTLALRSNLSNHLSFAEFLTQIKQVCLDAYANQDVPFEQLVEILQPERNLSHSPIFQVMFVLQNTAMDELQLPDLTITNLETSRQNAKFDLTLSMEEGQGQLMGEWEYNTDLFDESTIHRMSKHFEVLLSGLLAKPDKNIGKIPLITELEKHQLLVEWNQTEVNYPQNKCIHQLFEQQVTKNPDAVAVVFENEKLTYGELNRLSNQLANYLHKLEVSSDKIVGLYLEPSLIRIIALLGIFKAGAVYLPLDPGYPQERLEFMIKDSQVSLILTKESLSSQLSVNSVPIIDLDSIWETISQESSYNLKTEITSNHLAYIIYTSGSTGKPKGVLVSHQGLCNLAHAQIKLFKLQSSSRILQFSSLSFDASIWEIVMALGSGGSLYLGTFESLLPGQNLLNFLQEKQITHITLVPSALANLPYRDLPELKVIIVAGETCRGDLVETWSAGRQFFNAYGPTESTVCATVFDCQSMDFNYNPPIGRPIANTQIYILDNNLQLVPVGVPGELHIGGVGLANGYLNREDLTQKKFIPNPFGDDKLYKTGDLAYYLPDGNIKLLGRIDNQVKIRGFRIELGEIEAILNQHPHVQEAKVTTREDRENQKILVAYVIFKSHFSSSSDMSQKLREYLKTYLPDYMIPSAFVSLDSFPLTPNGKIDYLSLPNPDFSTFQSNYIAPRTPTEEIISNIWKQVLALKNVGINDNFFEVGGHSLLGTQIISRIRDNLNIEIPLKLFFDCPTIAQLSEHIEMSKNVNNSQSLPPIETRPDRQHLPLSFAQEGLWFLTQLEPNSTAYNMAFMLEIKGLLNIDALEKSINKIIERHEILRTNFSSIDGQPTQIINQYIDFKLSIVDLRNLANNDKKIEANRLVHQLAEIPFDIAKELLFSLKLFQLDENLSWLVFNIHHIIFDGWSYEILQRELFILYQAYCQKKSPQLPPITIQYADFSSWQRHWFTDENLNSQSNYWKEQLKGTLPILQLPTDRPRPTIQNYQGATKTFVLSPELTASIKAFCQREGVTLFMTLLAVFKVLLGRYSGQEDLIVGTAIAGRKRQEIENLIGFFVNTLALRSNLNKHLSFREFLTQIKQVCLDAYAHQDVPFYELVEMLEPERNLSYSPIFQVMFVLQNTGTEELKLSGLTIKTLETSRKTAKFDLILSMEERQGKLIGELEYNTDLFDSITIERMSKHFDILLSAILTNPQENIWQLPLLTEREKQQLLVDWNQTQSNYPKTQSIHGLFEEQVEKNPNATALIFQDQKFTYKELNEKANKLAHYLRKLGVKTEQSIGLYFQPSLMRIFALLAILKVGGVYVPLDVSYPQQRLEFSIKNSQLSLLLTEQSLADSLSIYSLQIISLDTTWEEIEKEYISNIQNNITGKNLAYLIYTSGSTGKPKGVSIPHQGVIRLVKNTNYINISSQDIFLQLASLSFDAATFEIWGCLLNGATLVIYPSSLPTLDQIASIIENHNISILWLTSGLFNLMVDEKLDALKTVRYMLAGGDTLSVSHVKKFIENIENCQLINGYGPTENTTFTCCYPVKKVSTTVKSIPIGRPIANTTIYVLDHYLNPVPVGVIGELYIGGDGLARGYLNLPELTQQSFIQNPFNPQERLYKTGDYVRYLPDGNVEFIGRIDNQVKIRGFRIELGEIEAVLNKHPQIKQTVVIYKEDSLREKQLIAYIVPQDISLVSNSQPQIIKQFREFLQQKLPSYMIPAKFVLLETLPLTPNGKIDRRILATRDESELVAKETFIAPRNPLELKLTKIWQKVLKIESVGVQDNFFDLGGHSLLAVRLVVEIEQVLHKKLSLGTLFQFPTIEQLAEFITNQESCVESIWFMQSKGSLPPLFFIHVLGRGLKFCRPIVEHLNPDQPVYGLNAQMINTQETISNRVEDLATYYIRQMQMIQPEGPYFLAGISLGGKVAYEMAQQLQSQGETVAFLALLDTYAPGAIENQAPSQKIPLYWSRFLDYGFPYLLNESRKKLTAIIKNTFQRCTTFQKNIYVSLALRLNLPLSEDMQDFIFQRDNIQASTMYVPKVYSGDVSLFVAEEEDVFFDLYRNPQLGWGKFVTGKLDVYQIPGTHLGMLQGTSAKILAEQLTLAIQRKSKI